MADSTSVDLILGTAGHIDHGKSALVLALTGTDPDRLSEEKARGITIELGFAQLKLPNGTTMGIVDVPGHERFVRQMIAGSTGIDVALLCIAADDGIMPQTEEHLAVLQLLGVPRCVIALTKIDLVDDEWVELITEEIQNRLATTPYAHAPIVPVSSRTGAGLDELKEALQDVAQSAHRIHGNAIIRLPVDRVFTIKGAGTVTTGTLWSGQVSLEDQLEVLPAGRQTRVRSIQMHNRPVEEAHAGNRVALNLVGLTTDDVRPGDFLVTPGSVQSTDRFDATLTYLGFQGWERPLETGSRVHVAHGTREVVGRVLLMDGQQELALGESALVQIRLDEPLPMVWKDRFVIRSFSPVHVVGGGTVLNAHPRRRTTLSEADQRLLNALDQGDETAVAQAAFAFATVPVNASDLAALSGLSPTICEQQLQSMEQEGIAKRLPGPAGYFAPPPMIQKYTAAIERELIQFHGQNPDALGISKEALRQRLMPQGSADAFDGLLTQAAASGVAEIADGKVSHPKAGAGSKQREQEAAARLLALLQEAGSTPPTVAELIAAAGLDASRGHSALRLLENQGSIIKVGKEFYFTADTLKSMEAALRELLAQGPASVAALKDALGVTRKFAIPVLEYFDNKGLTRRVGDERELASSM